MLKERSRYFLLSIDDGFCEWQYKIKASGDECIYSLYNAICKAIESRKYKGKLRRRFKTPNERQKLKKDLYYNRAHGMCETCGNPVPWSINEKWDQFKRAHLSQTDEKLMLPIK